MTGAPPVLRGVVQRVPDPDAAARWYGDVLGCLASPGPEPGWWNVDVGWEQVVVLAPGGTELPAIGDRWEHQGVIPILRTWDLAQTVAALDAAGTRWVNEVFTYEMLGTGRLGYVLGPGNQPLGIQSRDPDSTRDEDRAALLRREANEGRRIQGLGWLVFQVEDIEWARQFYGDVVGWSVHRGTEGFGHMLRIDEVTTLQVAFRGCRKDRDRDLEREPVAGLLRGRADAIVARFASRGGRETAAPPGFRGVTDPEGQAWLIEST